MKQTAAVAILAALLTSTAHAGYYAEDVIGVIKSDKGTVELFSESCADSGALIAARVGSKWADKAQWFSAQPGRVLFVESPKGYPVALACYEKTANGIRAYGPASAERIEYADTGIQWFRKPAQLAESTQTLVEPPQTATPAPSVDAPSMHDITTTTDDTYRYEVVEATCSDMARFLGAVPKPGDSARKVFVAWLAQQPGNFVFVDKLSDGKDTGERGCFVRTDSGYRITIHNRAQLVEYDRPR